MGLTKATIKNEDNGDLFTVLFNPSEYSLSKTNSWNRVPIRERNVPKIKFSAGNPTELKVQLFFDTYERAEGATPTDVREYTKQIIALTQVENFKDGRRPPMCRFMWGSAISFRSVITSLSYKYTLFLDTGTPVRATMDLSFQECEDGEEPEGQTSPPLGIPGYKMVIVKPGDTIDGIASREYGEPNLWRFISDCNNLENPKDLRPGQVLKITPIEELFP